MQRIKTGDTVEVISGGDKGERGEVLSIFPKQDKVIVSQINVHKKHQRAVQAGRQQINPGIIEFEAPLYLSNVMLVCNQCDQRTRVGFRFTANGVKVRYCKKCDADID